MYAQHAGLVHRYCARRVDQVELAEDLVSVVFLEVWRCRGAMVVVDGSARAWLLGVAKNVMASQRRSARRHRAALERYHALYQPAVADDEVDAVDDAVSAAALTGWVWASIACLPRGQQDVVELCLVEGLSAAAAARALGVADHLVKSRLHQARTRLRALARSGEAANLRSGRDHEHHRPPPSPSTSLELR